MLPAVAVRSAAVARPRPRLSAVPDLAVQANELLLRLSAARDQHLERLAAAAGHVKRAQAWSAFGYTRCDDFARERLGRTGRWFADLATLHELLVLYPALAAATRGADGGAPLGRVVALYVGKLAQREGGERETAVAKWIARARELGALSFVKDLAPRWRNLLLERSRPAPPSGTMRWGPMTTVCA